MVSPSTETETTGLSSYSVAEVAKATTIMTTGMRTTRRPGCASYGTGLAYMIPAASHTS